MTKIKWRLLFITAAVALIIIVGIRITSSLKSKLNSGLKNQLVLIVKTAKVTKGQLLEEIKLSGTIRPQNEVEIFPKIPGRIISLKHDVGDVVKAGEILATIEHDEISLQEKAAQASLAIAVESEQAAKNDLERAKKLFEQSALAKAQLEGIELKFAMAKAQTLGAKAQADIVSQQLKNAQVSSPIGGTITKRFISLGANAVPQQMIFTVQDIAKLKLVTTVDAQALVRLKKGTQASLVLDDKEFVGSIVTISPSLEERTRRGSVEIEIDDRSSKLLPNMFVHGALIMNKFDGVILVPNSAIVVTDALKKIFRIIDGKVNEVLPKFGATDGVKTVVEDGLNEGDLVAISGLDSLAEGTLVTIE